MQRVALLISFFFASSGFCASYSGNGAESVSDSVIKKYAPQALPGELTSKIESYLDLRAPRIGLVSPDGKKMFFTWNVTGTWQLWRVDSPKGFPVQMTGGDDRTDLVGITPDGTGVVLQRDQKGEENPGLYLQPAIGGELKLISKKPKVQTLFQFISDDGRYVYFKANDIKDDSYAIYRYEIASAKTELLFSQDGTWNVDDYQPDGRLLMAKAVGNIEQEYYEFNPKNGKLKALVGVGEKEEYYARYGANPDELIVLTANFGEFRRLYWWKAGKFEPITPDSQVDIADFYVDRPRTKIIYELNDKGYFRPAIMSTKKFKPVPFAKLEGADQVRVGSTTKQGRYTMFSIESGSLPRTSYSYDWVAGKLTQWTLPSTPEIDVSKFSRATLESYTARDGTRIPMYVRRPRKCNEPCPVIVRFHGGPELQAIPQFDPTAQIYIDAGFVYVEPNVRGSDGYGKGWLYADNGPKRLNVITDIEDCAKYIREMWSKDGKAPKVGVTGGSYGGYSAYLAMTMYAGNYDAGVAIVGISNLLTFLNNTAPYRRKLRAAEYGDPEKDKEALTKLSPMTYLDRVNSPLMIIQGVSDPRVPAGEAVQIEEALAKRKVPAELILFPDEGHGIVKRSNRVMEIGHTLKFFQEHLTSPQALK